MGFQTTVTDAPEEEYELIPEMTIHRAKLLEIKPKEISWVKDGEKKTATLLNWKWEIQSGEYKTRWVWGTCDSRMNNRAGNKFREWSETLLGRTLDVGTAFDTDDLLDLQADISIAHRADKKDPAKKYVEVDEVIPIDGGFAVSDEPPF